MLNQIEEQSQAASPAAPADQVWARLEALEHENAQLRQALKSRIVIEQAKGVLTERYRLDPGSAFELLRSSARSERRRIHDLAAEVVGSRRSPARIEALAAKIGTPDEHTEASHGAVEQAARSQVIFREVNEQIAQLSMRLDGLEMNLFVCECSNDECAESLEITPAEYHAVRAHGDRFFVLHGHQLPAAEHVVEANERFLVVEKDGPAAEVAIADNPRGP